MEEHLWGLPGPDETITAFNAFRPKSVLRTADVVHFNSHEANTCLRRAGKESKTTRIACRNAAVGPEVAMFLHYR